MDLVARASGLDEDGLWEAHGQRIYRYLLRLTGERETAEDLTQETFLQAIRDLRRQVVPPVSESAWLFRIATNRATDLFRRRRRISWLPFLADRHGGSTGDTAERVAEQDLVLQALRRLPPDTAAMLLLKDGEGFTTPEIADMLGQNYEAVRKRLARARETFRTEYLRLKEQR
ncbi:MAG TPA: RNA polymerase sigma factor [Symbiobacteriaceae bacterium]|nr:RNA polymerase sigma factor [Symbiobacteriaceae bacterium]